MRYVTIGVLNGVFALPADPIELFFFLAMYDLTDAAWSIYMYKPTWSIQTGKIRGKAQQSKVFFFFSATNVLENAGTRGLFRRVYPHYFSSSVFDALDILMVAAI